SDCYSVGYLFSCVVCGLLSFFALEHTLKNLDYLTFIVANRQNKPTMHGEWERAAELTRKIGWQVRQLFRASYLLGRRNNTARRVTLYGPCLFVDDLEHR